MISTGSFEEAIKKVEIYFSKMKQEESWRKNDDISFIVLRKIRS